jgi:hypothetical protein
MGRVRDGAQHRRLEDEPALTPGQRARPSRPAPDPSRRRRGSQDRPRHQAHPEHTPTARTALRSEGGSGLRPDPAFQGAGEYGVRPEACAVQADGLHISPGGWLTHEMISGTEVPDALE